MSVVLECPVCNSAFQVLPENAGKLVACPSCNEAVAVPEEVAQFEPEPEPVPMATPAPPLVFNCTHCDGKFGVTSDMDGAEVACPHCDRHVVVQLDGDPQSPVADSPAFPQVGSSALRLPKIQKGKKKKKIVIDIPGAANAKSDTTRNAEPFTAPQAKVDRKKKTNAPALESSDAGNQVKRTFNDSEPEATEADLLPPTKGGHKAKAKTAPKESRKSKPSLESKKPKSLPEPTPATKIQKSQPASRKPKPETKSETKSEPKAKTGSKPDSKRTEKTKPNESSPEDTFDRSEKSNGSSQKSSKPKKRRTSDEERSSKKSDSKKKRGAAKSIPASESETETETQEQEAQVTSAAEPTTSKAITAEIIAQIVRRLPPKFTIDDPEEDEIRSDLPAALEHEVVLPDGEGGYQRVDSRVVHVERNGEILELKAPTKESRAFNRMIQNVFTIGLGILILALAFWILIAW